MRLWRKCWQISGFMVSQRGIEVSPDQVKAVMETPPPRNKKELQRLTGKLVALGRFIARFTDELRPFFLAIRKAEAHGWTDSCQNAFEKIKHCLMQPPILSSPIPKEIVHISGALALRSAAQKLRPYFQAHPVIVLTDQPLRNILHKPDLTGRMLQWAIELSEFGIEFQPRLSMKGQVMADFVLEYSRRPSQHESSKKNGGLCELTEPHAHQALELGSYYSPQLGNIWSKPSGWDSLPLTMKQNMRPSCPDWTSPLLYPSPNSGSTDSQLVVSMSRKYEAKDARMARYLAKVRNTLQQFTEWTIEKIKRADNGRVDALAGIAASLPSKKPFYCLYMCKPIPMLQKFLLAAPLRQNKRMIKNGRITSQNISGQELYLEISNKHTKSGCKLPVSLNWGDLVQTILHRTHTFGA
ncbi:hypothetical protein CK203_046040 [Vitis vinifera]|uniref:Reverse transcriptase RNase H-like domain-containing protein n=1 Tax=Vitis vinifera TaxID=29760 RepID=A0A438HGU6_VITVI|nr:hypothetical protein CK203_046040 [Vitis vinifera]